MKIHAVSLFVLLSVLPLNAMDVDGKRLFDGRQRTSGRSKKLIRHSSAENSDPEGTNHCPLGEQQQEELPVWEFMIPLTAAQTFGTIKDSSSYEICQLLVSPEFKQFFSYATLVQGTAVIKNGRIKIWSIDNVFKRDGHENLMEIDSMDAGSLLALGNTIQAAQSSDDGQKRID